MATGSSPAPPVTRPRTVVAPSPFPLIVALAGVGVSAACVVLSTARELLVADILGWLITFAVVCSVPLQRQLNLSRAETGKLDQDKASRRQKVLLWLSILAIVLAVVHGWRIATWVGLTWFV